jgi:hypothetical protein
MKKTNEQAQKNIDILLNHIDFSQKKPRPVETSPNNKAAKTHLKTDLYDFSSALSK